jgi:hypothetical protein
MFIWFAAALIALALSDATGSRALRGASLICVWYAGIERGQLRAFGRMSRDGYIADWERELLERQHDK